MQLFIFLQVSVLQLSQYSEHQTVTRLCKFLEYMLPLITNIMTAFKKLADVRKDIQYMGQEAHY